MSPFPTDHPLTSQPSLFDAKAHPWLSTICRVLILALCFAPAILAGLYCYFTSDLGAEPNPFPEPGFALAAGSVVSFAIGVVCATAVVASYRLLAWIWPNARQ